MFGFTNFFIPGIGTLLAVCFGHRGTNLQLLVAFLQLVTAPLLIGWIFSIIWGIIIIRRPYTEKWSGERPFIEEIEEKMNNTVIHAIQAGERGDRYQERRSPSKGGVFKESLSV